MNKTFTTFFCSLLLILFCSCNKNTTVSFIEREDLFSLSYGNFENQLNLFDLADTGNFIPTELTMQNGFFYISNGQSKKILEMNSYGDLLSLYYNKTENPTPLFNSTNSNNTISQKNMGISTKKVIEYQFNRPSNICVDGNQRIYVVELLPIERQENENKTVLKQVVLRFDGDSFVDYIGQQGPGGTPFPFIKKNYKTANNELVVICIVSEGIDVYWFSESGYLLHNILINSNDAPNPIEDSVDSSIFYKVENVIPDNNNYKLMVKIDYYNSTIDETSKNQSGVEYNSTYVYPLDPKTGKYGRPILIPAYEESLTKGFSKQIHKNTFDFLGISSNGWMFFTTPTDEGYIVQMVDPSGNRVIKRLLKFDNNKVLYHSFSLSNEGIISALLAYKDKADVVWWRTDKLIDALLKK